MLNWLGTALADATQAGGDGSVAYVRASADEALLSSFLATTDVIEGAEPTLAMAREFGDPSLIVRALTARGTITAYDRDLAAQYFGQAVELARNLGDVTSLGQIRRWSR